MSQLEVDKIIPQSGTTLTLGDSGDTINFGSGVLPNFENLTVTGDLTVDTNSLKVDSTNNRVGIGTASPSVSLDVVGAITATGNITGTLATAAQPNITSVGTLTGLTVSGNIAGTLTTAAQPNITSVGTLTGFTSTGIDDNASTTSLTIASDGRTTLDATNEKALVVHHSDGSIVRIGMNNNSTNSNEIAFDSTDFIVKPGGFEKFRINSSGNVGIGTSSPSTSLHISQSQPIITLTDTDTSASHQLSGQSGSRHLNLKVDTGGSSGSPVFNLSMQDSIKLSVLNSGNVGIGTTTPSEVLHVVGDILATGGDFKSDANNYLGFSNNTFARFVINDSEKMRVLSDGKVGIGTSSPSEELEVSGVPNTIIKSKTTTSTALGGFEAHNSGGTSYIKIHQLGPSYGGTTFGGVTGNDQSLIEAQAASSLAFSTQGGTPDIIFAPARTARMTIKNGGNVGIGETSPLGLLHVKSADSGASVNSGHNQVIAENSGNSGMTILSGNTSNGAICFGDDGNNCIGYINYGHDGNHLDFGVNNAERMRIDSGGRLLVGTSSAPGDTDEVVIVGQATANGKAGMSVKSPTNHGAGNGTAIVAFDFLGNNYYSTSGKWGIYYRFLAENDAGSYADRGRMHFLPGYDGNSTTTGNGFLFRFNGNFTSDADDVADLGSSSNRWDDVYATNGTIQTSDQNEKQSIQSLTTAEMNVAKKLSSLIKTFKWNSSVEEKGDSARTHTGIIAQDVKQAFTDEGLDVANYALFISNTWWENSEGDIKEEATDGYTEKNRLGVRYSELLSFIQAYNDQRFTELEARITTLENA